MKLSLSKGEWASELTLEVPSPEGLGDGKNCTRTHGLGRDLSFSSWVIDGFVGLIEATTITDEERLSTLVNDVLAWKPEAKHC